MDRWLLFIPWHFPLEKDQNIVGASDKAEQQFKDEYPAIYNHLSRYKQQLSNRNKSETGIRYEWYALQRCAATYYQEFEKNKIMLPDISDRCEALFDNHGDKFCLNTAYIIPDLRKSDLGILNSKLILFFYSSLTQTIRGGYFRFIRQYLEKIPMVNSESLSDKVNQILDLKNEDPLTNTTKLEAELDQLVYQLYDLTDEEIKIIENA